MHGCCVEISSCFCKNPVRLFLQPSNDVALGKPVPVITGLWAAFATVHALKHFLTLLLECQFVLSFPHQARLLCLLYILILSSWHCVELSPQLILLGSHLCSLIDLSSPEVLNNIYIHRWLQNLYLQPDFSRNFRFTYLTASLVSPLDGWQASHK